MKGNKVLFFMLILFCLSVLISCPGPNDLDEDIKKYNTSDAGSGTGQKNDNTPQGSGDSPENNQPEPEGILLLEIGDLDGPETELQLFGELELKPNITKYEISNDEIHLCEGCWQIPLILKYSCGNEEFQITNLVNRPSDDDVIIYLNDVEYKCNSIYYLDTEDHISIPWYSDTICIQNDLLSTRVTIKFKYRNIISNELIFNFNQDLGNSDIIIDNDLGLFAPDLTGTWIADNPGLIETFIFNSDGTGTVYSLNNIQSNSFTWNTYKEGLSNILEISSSWFIDIQKIEYSINDSILTTSSNLGTLGNTFTRQ